MRRYRRNLQSVARVHLKTSAAGARRACSMRSRSTPGRSGSVTSRPDREFTCAHRAGPVLPGPDTAPGTEGSVYPLSPTDTRWSGASRPCRPSGNTRGAWVNGPKRTVAVLCSIRSSTIVRAESRGGNCRWECPPATTVYAIFARCGVRLRSRDVVHEADPGHRPCAAADGDAPRLSVAAGRGHRAR